jgi:site-specific recombinase XerD
VSDNSQLSEPVQAPQRIALSQQCLYFLPPGDIRKAFDSYGFGDIYAETEKGDEPYMDLKQAVQDFLEGYFSTHDRRKKTMAAYATDLKQFLEFSGDGVALPSLGGADVERWAAHLRQEAYLPPSIRRKIAVLKVFCAYWVRRGELKESPFWRVKLSLGRVQQLPRSLSEGEIGALLTQARGNYATRSGRSSKPTNAPGMKPRSRDYRLLRNLALVDLLFATGLRVGEASSLNVEDFRVQEGVFTVEGKGGRHRLAFAVDEKTLQIQKDHFAARTALETGGPALFLNASGKRLSTQGMAKIIAQLRREAGILRHVTPHMLRHTVATLLLRNGADIRVVQEFLGHASIATTQRYTHITKEHLVGALRKFHPSASLRLAS